MQLAIIKKKECDSKALSIVMQLLEPKVDPVWLVENVCTFSFLLTFIQDFLLIINKHFTVEKS